MLSPKSLYNELALAIRNGHHNVAINRAARLLVRLQDTHERLAQPAIPETGKNAELDAYLRNLAQYLKG